MSGKILVLDDEEKMARLIARSLGREGYEAEACSDSAQALDLMKQSAFDVLVTDLRMPGFDGLEILKRAKEIDPGIDVILMTAYASVDTVREAMKLGAVDYLEKPVSAEDDLKPLLRRLLADAEPREEKAKPARSQPAPSAPPPHQDSFPGVRCASPVMDELYRKALKVAKSNASVLLRGESGTGKEVLADLIQQNSQRCDQPYVKVNCGALTETLLESELFGHVKGSFTGAHSDREGLFKAADGGTILLDEVGEVSAALQVKLLRVLQQGEFTPVGGTRPVKVDVRVIAATNRDLESMVESGAFRQDLYYRLKVVPLEIPPLRERPEDLEALIQHFVKSYSPTGSANFSSQARTALETYKWPGNIRELENAVEHAMVLGESESITLQDLPAAIQDYRITDEYSTDAGGSVPVGEASLEQIEKACLLQALEKTGGNRTRAARILNITRRTLGYRLRKYGLEDEVNQRFS